MTIYVFNKLGERILKSNMDELTDLLGILKTNVQFAITNRVFRKDFFFSYTDEYNPLRIYQPVKEERIKKAIGYYKETGQSIPGIAKIFNLTDNTLYYWLDKKMEWKEESY